eukprot:CAMPEP_0197265644 /NCGR_PEP_ID=MMETSP1432-20130617/2523_1 /TAXON_ID=44447 /ORGANISM="Pseudo-nitzschia delicatissima, Strain UNC1205" /LENGTH=457 /DNA_ID=CAMNT_0042730413 /DNA_START=40 /DNA_END=1413 /DNA_ORIENTATION=+
MTTNNHSSPSNDSGVPYLVPACSTLSSASTTPPPSTRNGASQTLHDFIRQKGYSPPSRTGEMTVAAVEEETDRVFSSAGYWNRLDISEQVKMGFLISRNQHEREVPQKLSSALDVNTEEGKRLTAFVREGGDESQVDRSVAVPNYLANFHSLSSNEWTEYNTAPTLFNTPNEFKRMEPLVRFQTFGSTVCYLVTCAGALFYNQCLQTGTSHKDGVVCYGVNISRYMRNEFSDDEVHDYIFEGRGGYPRVAICRMLKPKPSMISLGMFEEVDCQGVLYSRKYLYDRIKEILDNCGALIIENFLVFEEYYQDDGRIEFSGDYDDFTSLPENTNNLHAMLVVGVKLVTEESNNDFGGVKLLIQDSNENRPFLVVGIDLLLSMGVKTMYAVREGFKYEQNDNNLDENAAHNWTRSGGTSVQNGARRDGWLHRNDGDDNVLSPSEANWMMEIDTTKVKALWT